MLVKGKRSGGPAGGVEEGRGAGGDNLREAVTLNISFKGGDNYCREAINRGMAIIRGDTANL